MVRIHEKDIGASPAAFLLRLYPTLPGKTDGRQFTNTALALADVSVSSTSPAAPGYLSTTITTITAGISDVELTIAYTAREGGGPLRQAAEADMTARLDAAAAAAFSAAQQPEGVTMLLQASKDFGVDWERFVRPTGPAQTTLALPIVRDRFAHVFQDPGVRVTTTGVEVLVVGQNGTQPFGGGPQVVTLTPPTGGALPVVNLAVDGQLARGSTDPDPEVTVTDTMWALDLSGLSVADLETLQDLIVVVRFSVMVNP